MNASLRIMCLGQGINRYFGVTMSKLVKYFILIMWILGDIVEEERQSMGKLEIELSIKSRLTVPKTMTYCFNTCCNKIYNTGLFVSYIDIWVKNYKKIWEINWFERNFPKAKTHYLSRYYECLPFDTPYHHFWWYHQQFPIQYRK